MFNSTVSLNLPITAMMVGKEKTLGGDDLTGTASFENDNSILNASPVKAVNIFSREF
jgi:hypothetical protein